MPARDLDAHRRSAATQIRQGLTTALNATTATGDPAALEHAERTATLIEAAISRLEGDPTT